MHKFRLLCGFPIERPQHSIQSKQMHRDLARCIYLVCNRSTMFLGEPGFLFASVFPPWKSTVCINQKYFSTWRRKQRGEGGSDRDFTRSHWMSRSGASWLSFWWAADAISVKIPCPVRSEQEREAAVVVVGKTTWRERPAKQTWAALLLGFSITEEATAAFTPSCPFRGAPTCAKELNWVLPAPDRRINNLGSQTKEAKGMRKCPMRLWSSTEGRKKKKKESLKTAGL